MIKSSVYNCSVIELPINHRDRGNLTVAENGKNIPFDVHRVYYLYDVPAGESRGGHAHRELKQLIIAASGSFNVVLSDGKIKRTITLNRPFYGLLVVPGIWRELDDFSSGSICLVMASRKYDAKDYIRGYEEFLAWKGRD
ncbi:MAG: FdtA/QdtA family cupin domain-containing protein [Fibromonadaceae bacterium]|jgi:hypothetical protein|nr:FdtA/QdtA family cupin domain-containing protein [Fibromonadaceae bacterium]